MPLSLQDGVQYENTGLVRPNLSSSTEANGPDDSVTSDTDGGHSIKQRLTWQLLPSQ